jgi:hypothetical protein
MNIKKGDKVKCLACYDGEFTVGEVYEVQAGPGDDDDTANQEGTVLNNSFILACDSGQHCYCISIPGYCLFGKWEKVND